MSERSSIGVLIADDSVFMRFLIRDLIQEDPDFEVVGTASNGKEAVEKNKELLPDVVLMDMSMGEYDGIYGISQIMATRPVPIIILSALGNSNMDRIMEGLQHGAIDYICKPQKNDGTMNEIADDLKERIRQAAKLEMVRPQEERFTVNHFEHTFDDRLQYDVILIGSSTGGPPAIEKIITNLPNNLVVPVIIAQHMPSSFVPSFANRLNALTGLNVFMARKGDVVKAGNIMILSGSRNSILTTTSEGNVVIDYTSTTYKEFNYPSVNALFLSGAAIYGSRAIGVILTGMGRDGTDGMIALKKAGARTIIQDKNTSVVFGMPGSVLEHEAADHQVPIGEMGGFLVSCL